MIPEDILIGKTVVSLRSKDEAVEYVSFLRDVLGDKLYDHPDGFFYPRAEFHDKCVEYYGNTAGDEPAIIVEIDIDDDGENRYTLGYCNTSYFKNNFYSAVYYSDICEDAFKVDSAECWSGDVMQLLI